MINSELFLLRDLVAFTNFSNGIIYTAYQTHTFVGPFADLFVTLSLVNKI